MLISAITYPFLRGTRRRPYLCKGIFTLLLTLSIYGTGTAQRVALKTNLVDWGTLSPSLGCEFAVSNRMTLDLTAAGSPFKLKNDFYYKHFRFQPELRYWFENLLSHHYVGVTAFYSNFDAAFNKKGYYGDAYAAGFTYGYNWLLSRRWNLEVSGGIGAIHYRMARYRPGTSHPQPDDSGWIPAPVKLSVCFTYILK